MPGPVPVAWDDQMVDVGGRCLRVGAAGTGSPAVVFENALGSSKESWGRIPAEMALISRVFVYNRAGVGGSDPTGRPRLTQDIIDDLRVALQRTGVLPPYVLVGHSLGSLGLLLYASQHPQEVAGIVSIDGTNPQYPRLMALASPVEQSEWRRVYRGENAEGIDIEASAAQVRTATPLPPVPLVVVTAGRWSDPKPGSPSDPIQMQRMRWVLQQELADQVPGGRHIVARESGHFVQRDQPELVKEVIRSVVEEVRRAKSSRVGDSGN